MTSLNLLALETTTMMNSNNSNKFLTKKITSPQNALFKSWKSLLTSKGLKDPEFPFCIVSGKKLVAELLKLSTDSDSKVFIDALVFSEESLNQNHSPFIQQYSLPNLLFKELDVLGTHSPLLIVKQPKIKTWNPQSPPQGLEVILPLGDPSNLGAAIRSATAFGATKVVLTQESAHPFLPKSIKASSGTVFLCHLQQGHQSAAIESAIEGPVVTLDLQGTCIYDFVWPKDFRLLVGEEGQGVRTSTAALNSHSQKTITIPMQNGVESLNANVSLSLALYEFQRSQKLAFFGRI
jgi:TrmH family RNA methyltransferase